MPSTGGSFFNARLFLKRSLKLPFRLRSDCVAAVEAELSLAFTVEMVLAVGGKSDVVVMGIWGGVGELMRRTTTEASDRRRRKLVKAT